MARRLACLAVLASCVAASTAAFGQGSPPPEPAAADAKERARGQAQDRFFRGLELFEAQQWDAALAEFLESRRLHPTRAATRNAGLCLRNLHRYAEAFELFDQALRAFGAAMPDDERAAAARELDELAAFVGTIEIQSAEAGATILVDGEERGQTPAPPLRVSAGTHLVQLHKTGFFPAAETVTVAGRASARATLPLRVLGVSGRLRVTEQAGRGAAVIIDNVEVGRAPWEGPLAVGEHSVLLRGEGLLGSSPASAPVRIGELTSLTLVLEPLACEVRVAPVPADAAVAVDGVAVGRGTWGGRLRAGEHRFEVGAEGYVPIDRRVLISPGLPSLITIELERDRTSSLWRRREQPRFTIEADLGALVGLTLGGEVAKNGCGPSCSAGPAAGVLGIARAGYRLGSGIGFSVDAGYVGLTERVTGRGVTLDERPDAVRRDLGVADDEIALRALLVGASVAVHRGVRWRWTGRLGAGVLLGSLADTRAGAFEGAAGPYEADPLRETSGARFFHFAPEVRLGLRLSERAELSVGAAALVLVALERPSWRNERDVVTPSFFGFYEEETLVGSAALLVSPTLGFRLEL